MTRASLSVISNHDQQIQETVAWSYHKLELGGAYALLSDPTIS